MAGAAAISGHEAIRLASSWVARVCDERHVRYLLIKGISLEAHLLRSGHQPADVDLLVEPGFIDEVLAALGEAGWEPRPTTVGGTWLGRHSETFLHERWPVDLDVHSVFPGLLAGPERAFDALWNHRQRVSIAGQPCWIPDRASSIVMWALHSLRGTRTQARHADELAQLVANVIPGLSEADRRQLSERIIELGADEPLRAIPAFAEIIGDRYGPQAPGARDEWLGSVAQARESSPWWQMLRDARPSERPWLLFRAVWPSAHDMRITDERLIDTPLGRVQSRGRRAWRLVKRIVQRRRQAR